MTYHFIPATLERLAVPLESLTPYPGNARRGKVSEIVASIQQHGQYKPITVNTRMIDGTQNIILAGNHTYQAMCELRGKGATHIAVTFVDVDADQAARINLIDNRLNDVAEYDTDALLEQLTALPDLDGTGYTPEDVDSLLEKLPAAGDAPSSEMPSLWGVAIEVDSEAEQVDLLTRFEAEGFKVRALL